MTIQIQILAIDADKVRAAFYYTIASPLVGAVDSTRQPAAGSNTKLSAADITALQNGSLFEFVVDAIITGKSAGQAASMLQTMYTNSQSAALAQYATLYTNKQYLYFGFDGNAWS